jgi:5-methylcytosine-specific restriction protein A
MEKKKKNPNWGRDETILALDLFLKCNGKIPNKDDTRVIELSQLLRQNPIHTAYFERKNFRSPSAVVLKLGNIQQEADGAGMPNNSELDKMIWAEFGKKPLEVSNIVNRITSAMQMDSKNLENNYEENFEFQEGRTYTRIHLARERNPNLRKKVLQTRKANGKMYCEVCEATYSHLDEKLRNSAYEVHHITPLSSAGKRTVNIRDVALLCASCHRLIHKLIADHKRHISINDARVFLREK